MAEITHGAYGTHTELGADLLNNVTNGSRVISAAIDNTSNKDLFMDVEIKTKFGTNPTANSVWNMYLIPSLDGTNYGDGDASVAPPASAFVGAFEVRAVTTQQRILAVRDIPIPALNFKLIFENKTGQTSSNSAGENEVYYRTHTLEVA